MLKEAGNFFLPDRVKCRVSLLAGKREKRKIALTRLVIRSGEMSGKYVLIARFPSPLKIEMLSSSNPGITSFDIRAGTD